MIGFKIKTAIVYCWAKLTFGDAIYVGDDDGVTVAIARTTHNPLTNTNKMVYYRTIKPPHERKRKVKRILNPNGDIGESSLKWIYVNKSKRTESILKRD